MSHFGTNDDRSSSSSFSLKGVGADSDKPSENVTVLPGEGRRTATLEFLSALLPLMMLLLLVPLLLIEHALLSKNDDWPVNPTLSFVAARSSCENWRAVEPGRPPERLVMSMFFSVCFVGFPTPTAESTRRRLVTSS